MPHHCRGKYIAQEAQLLAEERWIVNALKNIRTQRNCLQIERLQLESTLARLKFGQAPKDSRESHDATTPSVTQTEDSQTGLVSICSMLSTATESRVRDLDDGVCNFEELNLNVTQPVFSMNDTLDINIEFEEDDSEDEEDFEDDNEENVEIDMNMFMNAEQSNKG